MKGKKVIMSYKDTYNMDTVLNPVIAAWLKKFIEVKHSDKARLFGVPTGALAHHGLISEDRPIEDADKVWDEVLEKMLYAFDDNEPNITKYDFDFDFVPTSVDPEYGQCYTMQLKPGTEAENERYDRDMKEHEAKVKEGRELFFKFYDNLWW